MFGTPIVLSAMLVFIGMILLFILISSVLLIVMEQIENSKCMVYVLSTLGILVTIVFDSVSNANWPDSFMNTYYDLIIITLLAFVMAFHTVASLRTASGCSEHFTSLLAFLGSGILSFFWMKTLNRFPLTEAQAFCAAAGKGIVIGLVIVFILYLVLRRSAVKSGSSHFG